MTFLMPPLESPAVLLLCGGLAASVILAVVLASRASHVQERSARLLGQAGLLSRKLVSQHRDVEAILGSLPVKLMVVDKSRKNVISVTDQLADYLSVVNDSSLTIYLTSLLRDDSLDPDVLPGLRRCLKGFPERVEPFEDKIESENGSWVGELQKRVSVSVLPGGEDLQRRTLVVIEDASASSRDMSASRYSRSVEGILTEPNLSQALSNLAELVHDNALEDVMVGVTFLNPSSQELELISDFGFPEGLRESLRRIPVIFGRGVNATAAVLCKDVCADLKNPDHVIPEELVRLLSREEVERWWSYPIIGLGGEVVGTLDLLAQGRPVAAIKAHTLTNLMYLIAATVERYQSMVSVQQMVMNERLVRQVNQQLLTAAGSQKRSSILGVLDPLCEAIGPGPGCFDLWYLSDEQDRFCLASYNGDADKTGDVPAAAMRRWLASHPMPSIPEGEERGLSLEAEFGCVRLDNGGLFPASGEDTGKSISAGSSGVAFPLVVSEELEGVLVFRAGSVPSKSCLSVISRVAPSIAGALARQRLVGELTRKALYDQLTGLCNRAHIEDALRVEINRSSRYGHPLTVLLFDIDHFKSINDTYGHDVGDRVLKEVAQRAENKLRSVDLVGRWGGEEFLVILAETEKENAMIVAEGVRKAVEGGDYGLDRPVTVSIGVASFHEHDLLDTLIKRADLALYEAKHGGRNRVVLESGTPASGH